MELDKIPSFITSSNCSFLLKTPNEIEINNIKRVLQDYYNDYLFDFKPRRNGLEIIKKGRYLRNNKYISRLSTIGFQQNFTRIKAFEPIVIESPNKILLSINFGILVKSLINSQTLNFNYDMNFNALKRLFPLLRGREEYMFKKEDLRSLLFYAKKLDASKFISSERIRCGSLVGVTNFRIGDCLYDIKYKNRITSKEFFKPCVYATILNEMGIKINKIIILSTKEGYEYIMPMEPNILIESTLDFYRNEKVENLDFFAFD